MDRFDRQLMDFVRSWAPYGGPPSDEVMLEFGMTREQLTERITLIVASEQARREQELHRPWLRMPSGRPAAVHDPTDARR
ncbi:hypothetical protein [Mycolicibacterium sediminis]|uniref:DUF3263 domain-containing protein n=1 Tax=Mycolicibacterium sediminis TaxID=1286180 RepID=A0A7I7QKT6_9MYCO|nr:hypothetical protein [Mycolicibacterium sediminis]BBY26892.1 hypothetical protein MSEDJ_09880 [Mycolicibacterium sediminis]